MFPHHLRDLHGRGSKVTSISDPHVHVGTRKPLRYALTLTNNLHAGSKGPVLPV